MHWSRFFNLNLLVGLLCIQPLFTLVIKGWSSGSLVLGGLVCFVLLLVSRQSHHALLSLDLKKDWEYKAFLLANSLLFISIFFTGLIRGDLHVAILDSPSRFLFAIPVFMLIRRTQQSPIQPLSYTITLALVLTLIDQTFFKSKHPWSADRMSSYFADPLAFGYISLALSMMALTTLVYVPFRPRWRILLTVTAIGCGIYMSVMTASRTGWLAIPLVVLFLMYLKREWFTVRNTLATVALIVLALTSLYTASSTVKTRVADAIHDVTGYSFVGTAPDTSLGLRITFLRIAKDLITERPLTGYGDTQKVPPAMPAVVNSYASPFAIHFALSSGFHNEFVTNSVQYGLPAGFAVLLLFLIPLLIYWKNINNPIQSKRLAASLGIVFTLVYLISSLSTEVFGLKYTASFYGLMTALLCATATRTQADQP